MGESVAWTPDDISTLAAYRRENAALRVALAAARRALEDLYALVEDGLLVRSTTNDHHLPSYVAEATRITAALSAALIARDRLRILREPMRGRGQQQEREGEG